MKWKDFRENAEAIIVALLLALLIRHFVLESYEIPTGSMAPYLHGLNARVECPNCGVDTPVGIASDPLTNRVLLSDKYRILEGTCNKTGVRFKIQADGPNFICPGCKETRAVSEVSLRTAVAKPLKVECRECTFKHETLIEAADVLGGNKILVDKLRYDAFEPDRWDVVVFRFNSQRNYIKRLVGLPGEQLQIINGDIWIDGEIEVKPPHVQKHMWIPVHDSSILEAGLIAEAWSIEDGERLLSSWSKDTNWTRYDAAAADSDDKVIGGWGFNFSDSEGKLVYSRPVRNYYGYNGNYRGSPPAPIRDLKVSTQVRAMPRGGDNSAITLEIENTPSRYQWRIPFNGKKSAFNIVSKAEKSATNPDGNPDWEFDFSLRSDVETNLSMEVVDRTVRFFADGELIGELPLPESEITAGTGRNAKQHVRVHVSHCGGYLKQVQIYRDLHWTGNGNYAVTGPFDIDQGRYFVLGDNSPSSLDSRYWGSFARSNLLGRGFVIFWPALPGRNESGFIR